jgi:serine protease inhibitor
MYSGLNDKQLLSFHRDLNKYLLSSGKLQIANSIWYHSHIQLNPYFKKQIACISENKTPIVQQDVDDWVSVKTNGMINNMEVSTLADIVVLNAIYFKDTWEVSFKNDKIDRFVSWDGHESEVKYMKSNSSYMYTEDDTAQAILLNYNSPFSMLIILPQNSNEPIPLSHKDIKTLISMMSKQNIELYLPKFEYEDTHSLMD